MGTPPSLAPFLASSRAAWKPASDWDMLDIFEIDKEGTWLHVKMGIYID
jgi:hypothetical protein